MNGSNKKSDATKISQQLHKNLTFQNEPDTIQQVAAVPARGYITYSSSREIVDHRGDGQWQPQMRYAHPKANQLRNDAFGSYHNQANYINNDYGGDDPLFDEFLSSLMESFKGYNNANIIGYRSEFAPPVGYYNDPNVNNIRYKHSVQIRDKFSRPDSPSARAPMSVGPGNDQWLPEPRPSASMYPEHQYAQPRFGPPDRTKFNYPDSSLRKNDVHPRTEWSDVPGNQRSEFFPRQNMRYIDHQYPPHDPTNQTQFMRYSDHQYAPQDPINQTQSPNTPPQRNSRQPVLSTRFEEGKLPDAGGYGHPPSGEVDSFRNSPKEGYNYSYAPPAPTAPRDSMTHPERETSWDVKVHAQPTTGEKISNMTTGALTFAKKNLYPAPEMANRWQFSNQPQLGEKEEGNTRPEFSTSQGKGSAYPEMAKSWLSKQINTGERNPHNETSDFPQPTQFPTSASQENGNRHPEFSKSASRGKGTAFPEMAKSWLSKQSNTGGQNPHHETMDGPDPSQFHVPASQEVGNTRPEFSKSASRGKGTAFPEMPKSWFSKQSNTGEEIPHYETVDHPNPSQFHTPASQEVGHTRPEFSKSASRGKGTAFNEMAKSWLSKQSNTVEKNPHDQTLDVPDSSQFHSPASQEVGNTPPEYFRSSSKGNAGPEIVNSWDIDNQPNYGEAYSNATAQNQVLPDSQERGTVIPEASNGAEINEQPNNMGRFSKLGAMNRAKKNQFPSLFSKQK